MGPATATLAIVDLINEADDPAADLHSFIVLLIASVKQVDGDKMLAAVNEGMSLRARHEASHGVHH